MHEQGDGRTLDQVLSDFERTCPTPNMADVRRWQASHPEHARAILHSAALTSRRILADRGESEPRPDPRDEVFVSSMVRAHMASRQGQAGIEPLVDLLALAGLSLEEFEGAIGLHPGVLGPVLSEGLAGPVPKPLAREVATALGIGPERAAASLALVPSSAGWGYASSRSAPGRRLRTFEEAILATDMPEDRKAFWLGD